MSTLLKILVLVLALCGVLILSSTAGVALGSLELSLLLAVLVVGLVAILLTSRRRGWSSGRR